MTIVFYIVLFISTATAQPLKLLLDVKQLDRPGAPQSSINASGDTRDLPFPPGANFELLCIPTGSITSNPWVSVNNTADEEVPKIDLDQVASTMLSVYSYQEGGIWILGVKNFNLQNEGIYECRDDGLLQSINLVQSNPGIAVSDIVQEGQRGKTGHTIRILVTGDPYPVLNDVKWYKDGVELTEEKRVELQIGILSSGNLFFSSLDYLHSGVYTAEVSNTNGIVNASSTLIVVGEPEVISLAVSTDNIYIGEKFKLTCNVTDAFPVPDVTWSIDGSMIVSGQDGYIIAEDSLSSILSVTSARDGHTGQYRCSANNSIGVDSKAQNILISLILPPKPIVTISSVNNNAYAGSSITLVCSTSLANPTHIDKMVMVLWKMNNEPLNITSSDRHSVQEETANDVYNNMLTVNPTSSSTDSGNYSCIVTIYNNTISSEAVASDNVLLNITIPPIGVSLTPLITNIVDFAPYNSIKFNCTSNLPIGVSANIQFRWLLGDVVIDDTVTDSLSITVFNESSVLTGSLDSAGSYQYVCDAIVELSPYDSPVIQSVNAATVNVQGPTVPNSPVSISSQVSSYNSVYINFTINDITYSRETYYVLYGLSSDDLFLKSAVIQGNENLTTKNEKYSIPLHYLAEHNSIYYYVIVANNSKGLTRSSVKTFQTPKIVLAQFKAGPFKGCVNGRIQDSVDVENFFKEKLSEQISINSGSLFYQDGLVNGSLHCTTASSNTLIYRVYIIPTDKHASSQTVTDLEQWIASNPTLIAGKVAAVSVDSSCDLIVSSPDDPLCDDQGLTVERITDCNSALLDVNTVILISVIAGTLFFLLIVVMVAMIFIMVYQHKRLKRMSIRKTSNQYSIVNCKRETSFIDHSKRSPPAIPMPGIPTQWEGDVSISDCPAYLYSVKPIEDEPTQTIVERQPTPGIYDSIDGLNNASFHHIKASNPLTNIENCQEMDDCTGSSGDYS